MARVFLVRHAEPAEAIGEDPDLTPLGIEQATRLVELLQPCALVTSPLRRTRSTARALETAWDVEATVDDTYREMPSPTTSIDERRRWLRSAMQSTFGALGPEIDAWRRAILSDVARRQEDTVIVTHALVINALAGSCISDDRVLHMRPAHASITVVEVDERGALTLHERGPDVESLIG
jgi:broad specificity phosphatase PhoE